LRFINIKRGMFARRLKQEKQSEFWVMSSCLPKATPSRFYELVERTLQEMDFAARVWELCRAGGLCRGSQRRTPGDRSGGLFENVDGGFL
jgi:hypothetical protein